VVEPLSATSPAATTTSASSTARGSSISSSRQIRRTSRTPSPPAFSTGGGFCDHDDSSSPTCLHSSIASPAAVWSTDSWLNDRVRSSGS
jgi:hypothetical protein